MQCHFVFFVRHANIIKVFIQVERKERTKIMPTWKYHQHFYQIKPKQVSNYNADITEKNLGNGKIYKIISVTKNILNTTRKTISLFVDSLL